MAFRRFSAVFGIYAKGFWRYSSQSSSVPGRDSGCYGKGIGVLCLNWFGGIWDDLNDL